MRTQRTPISPRAARAIRTALSAVLLALTFTAGAQTRFPDEIEPHEGTWLTWPHQNGGMVHCVTQQQPAVPLRLATTPATATTMTLNFNGDPGHTSRLQATPKLAPAAWADLESFTLNGQSASFSTPTTSHPRRFFRVVTP
jgi:hypothetical protein